ncbi:MAG: hypothetical protein IKU17_01385 [Clostridia bacterium]|nr:hypothetical protein [Clostridia bacterium]
MIIEALYPEMCNLFGDGGNMRYLCQCLPNAEYITTSFGETPAFVQKDVSLLYIGPMTESAQVKLIEALKPYKARLQEMIDNGTVILATGNAHEIFGKCIDDVNGTHVDCLGLFDYKMTRDMMRRSEGLALCKFGDMEVFGFRATFTQTFLGEGVPHFAEVLQGKGMNRECAVEGIRVNNFFGTYLLGPLLVLNPYFTKDLIRRMGGPENPTLAFEPEVIQAYDVRIKEVKDRKLS